MNPSIIKTYHSLSVEDISQMNSYILQEIIVSLATECLNKEAKIEELKETLWNIKN